MKKFFLSLIAVIMCFTAPAFAEIYTYDETEEIMNGVQLRHIRRFYGTGWLNINAVTADLKSPELKLELLKGANIDSLSSMASLADDTVVAAANADFFDNTRPAYSQGFSLGIEVKDGELLQSQIDENMAAGFYDGQRLDLRYMTMSITVTAPSGETRRVAHLNKHTDYYGDILMYTSNWNNGWSPAPGGSVAELVVDGGTVTEVRRGLPSVQIPENGFVLAVDESVDGFFYNFSAGAPLEPLIVSDPSLEGVKTAFGGGTLLLKDGQKTEITHNIAGAQPRTCVGTNADGTVVYIITVDGRQAASKGATLSELADVALELGCANAMNLDGGGSTRLLARDFWNDEQLGVVNLPTENRKVINAVAVTTDAKPGPAAGVRLRADGSAVLAGDLLPLEAKLFDANGLSVADGAGTVSFSAEGADGIFSGGYFIPQAAGDAVITAVYVPESGEGGAVSNPIDIHIIGEVSAIDIPQEIHLDVGQSLWLNSQVSDGAYTVPVRNPDLLSPTSGDPAVASYGGGMLTGLSSGYAVLTLSHGGATAYSLIIVGDPDEPAPALPNETFQDTGQGVIDGGASFSVFAFEGARETIFDNILYKNGLERISGSSTYGFLGEYKADRLPDGVKTPIKADSFSALDKGFVLVISLPKDGRLTDLCWVGMSDAVSATNADTVVVLTNSEPSGAADYDTQVFYDYLSLIAQEKNVYIVRSGLANGLDIKDGVRILTLADSSDYASVSDGVNNSWILKFTVSGGECKYDFERLYA